MRKAKWAAAIALAAGLLSVVAVQTAAARTNVSRTEVTAFQAAGDAGGGVLTPGDFFAPTNVGQATLIRQSEAVEVTIQTSGLPPGAYTVWWVVFNDPSGCAGPCGEDDLFNLAAEPSVFWATGGVVGVSGIGTFVDRHGVNDSRGEPGTQDLINFGGIDPAVAEIHNVIKYHGPASEDPDILYEQTHTVLGSCLEGANAVDFGPPFGVQCFDPQAAVHPLP